MRARSRVLLLAGVLAAAPAVLAQTQPLEVLWGSDYAYSDHGVALSPDGATVVIGRRNANDGWLDLRRISDAGMLGGATQDPLGRPLGLMQDVAFRPDGAAFVSAHGRSSCSGSGCGVNRAGLYLWSATTVQLIAQATDIVTPPMSVAFTPDGQYLLVSYGHYSGPIEVRDAGTLALVRTLSLYSIGLDLQFSSGGGVVTAFARLPAGNSIQQWDVATGVHLRSQFPSPPCRNGVYCEYRALSRDGQLVAGFRPGATDSVFIDRVADGTRAMDLHDATWNWQRVGGVGFSPNGRYLFVGGWSSNPLIWPRVMVWDLATGEQVGRYVVGVTFGKPTRFEFSRADPHLLVMADDANRVLVARVPMDLTVASGEGPLAEAFRLTWVEANPSPAPTLALAVAEAQRVRAEAFDVLGRCVAVLFDGEAAPGAPVRLALDGADLAPGAYVVRVTGETFTAARTVTVAR